MKKHLLRFAACFLIIGICESCNSGNNNSDVSNYWDSNTLVHNQLRGAVKTVTTNNGETVTTYNTDGYIVSMVSSGTDASSVTYSYENDKLMSETYSLQNVTAVSGRTSTSFTTYYEYNNEGKYIPRGPIHFLEYGLVPNLSAVIQDDSRDDFVFNGNDLWLISTTADGTETVKDTLVFTYDGNYPSDVTTLSSYCQDMSYASNGMFKNYTEAFYGADYDDAHVYTFLVHDTYLLPSSMVETYKNASSSSVTTTNYAYNTQMDILSQTSDTYSHEYADYVYDEQGNWVSRNYRYKNSQEAWSDYTTETRTITYW
jgi:hypothetical protein